MFCIDKGTKKNFLINELTTTSSVVNIPTNKIIVKGFVNSDLVLKKIESEEKFTPISRYSDSIERTNNTTVGEKSRNQELSKFMNEKTAFPGKKYVNTIKKNQHQLVIFQFSLYFY